MRHILPFFLLLLLGMLPPFSGMATNLSSDMPVPRPREISTLPGTLALPAVLTVSLPEKSASLLEFLANGPARNLGLRVESARPDQALVRLRLASSGVPENDEGYTLKIDSSGIDLASRNERGLFYGIQTLNDLLRKAEQPVLPFCAIRDYPTLALRGVFLYAGNPRLRELIDLFASLKFNTVVLEFGSGLPYSGRTFGKEKWTQAQLDDLLAYIRNRQMEVIPHLQLLSHAQWLASHPDYLDLIEDKSMAKSWNVAYCPSDPRIQKIVAEVVEGTISTIKPRYFHFCFDEIGCGPFGVCERCRKQPPAELLGSHAAWVAGLAKKHGVTPIFYQDSFCGEDFAYAADKGDGARAVEFLPRDSVINLWDYNRFPRRDRLEYFRKKGFRVYGASWVLTLGNNSELPRLIAQAGPSGLGSVLTFWDELPSFSDFRQISPRCWSSIAVAADYCWNPDAGPLEDLPYDPAWEVRRRLEPQSVVPRAEHFAPLPLGKAVNAVFGVDPAFPRFTPAQLAAWERELAATQGAFRLARQGEAEYCGVRLAGKKNDGFPAEVSLPINGRVETAALLLTMIYADRTDELRKKYRALPQIGNLELHYTDGTHSELPLRAFWNVEHWNATQSPFASRVQNRTHDERGLLVRVPVVEFRNPSPGKMVSRIVLRSAMLDGVSPVLLAASVSGCAPADAPSATLPSPSFKQVAPFPLAAQKTQPELIIAGKFAGKVGLQRKGDNWELIVPPLQRDVQRGRFSVDFPVSVASPVRAVTVRLYCSDPSAIFGCAFYLGDEKFKHCLVRLDLLAGAKSEWVMRTFAITAMRAESGGIKSDGISQMRLSFWTINRKPLVIRFAPVEGFSDDTEALLEKRSIAD